MKQRVLIWDFPTRVFHWLLAISFAGAFLTTESESYFGVHLVLGYTMLGLILFRLVWGVVGSRYARFSSFLFSPGEIVAYARSIFNASPLHYAGHNPAGSVAIFLMLLLGIATGASGYLLLQNTGGEALEELHEAVSYGMLMVVILHVAGVLLSSVLHRENLARSMISGYKRATGNVGIRRAYAWLGVIMLASVVTFWVFYPATGLVPPNNELAQAWQQGDDD